MPTELHLSASAGGVVWAFVGFQRLFRSTDEGDHWQESPGPLPHGAAPPSFIDATHGWLLVPGSPATQCMGQPVSLYTTTDGGISWAPLPATGIGFRQCKKGLAFTDQNHGYLSGWDKNAPPVIYRTADGGQSWAASAPLPDPPGWVTSGGGLPLQPSEVKSFDGTLLVAAYGSKDGDLKGYVFRSTDGGASWGYVAQLPRASVGVAYVTSVRWLQLVVPELSMETDDGGYSWHAAPADYSQAAGVAPLVVFGDSNVGYATVRGTIERTTDGGVHWVTIATPGVG